jgi:hypothetical protein
MRYNQSTLKASTVHAYANHLLRQTLEVESHQPALSLGVVASVLLLAACWQTSLTGACRLVKEPPSHRHVRNSLYACLPPRPRDLLARLLAMLWQTLPDYLRRVPRVMAVDLHQRPYYGKKSTKGCTLRQKKKSTRKSFTYATLAVLDRCGRFTAGLLPTRPTMRLTTILEQLLLQAAEVGLTISYLLLDKDFYCAEVIAFLQKRGVAFLMPAKKKGKKAGCGNHHLFQTNCPVGWYDYTWETPIRRWDFKTMKKHTRGSLKVTVRMCVACTRGSAERRVYASWGLLKWSPAQVVQEYRRRFGIETKYRQLGQCLAVTSSRCERLRLLLVGIALLWCNLWAYLHAEAFSHGPVSARTLHGAALRLLDLIVAVATVIATRFGGWIDDWLTQQPLPPKLAAFQT